MKGENSKLHISLDEEDDIIDPSSKEDEETPTNVRYAISSYGADYPVDGLVKRLDIGDITIPEFQRGFVWTMAQASRFIESLLLGLPVPGIFLSKDPDSQKIYVIDGQQRLKTLLFFYNGVILGREFRLRGVKNEFDGLTYKTLSDSDRRRLDDSILHATVIRQDDPENDQSSIYLVFERLNSYGTPLSSQEIRSCVYQGKFSDLLKKLNKNTHWRELYGTTSKRQKDQELILRFFALFYDLEKYERPMNVFLTEFMAKNRQLKHYSAKMLSSVFVETVSFALNHLGRSAFRPERSLNVSVTDALLVGTALSLKSDSIEDSEFYRLAFNNLMDSPTFIESYSEGTTDEKKVKGRIREAAIAFGASDVA